MPAPPVPPDACGCAGRADFFEPHPDEELPEFLAGLSRVRGELRDVYKLHRCVGCGQLWIVDDVTRGPLAVRARAESDLDDFDERPYRRALGISRHGGVQDRECLQRGCSERALRGVALCVDHLYGEHGP